MKAIAILLSYLMFSISAHAQEENLTPVCFGGWFVRSLHECEEGKPKSEETCKKIGYDWWEGGETVEEGFPWRTGIGEFGYQRHFCMTEDALAEMTSVEKTEKLHKIIANYLMIKSNKYPIKGPYISKDQVNRFTLPVAVRILELASKWGTAGLSAEDKAVVDQISKELPAQAEAFLTKEVWYSSDDVFLRLFASRRFLYLNSAVTPDVVIATSKRAFDQTQPWSAAEIRAAFPEQLAVLSAEGRDPFSPEAVLKIVEAWEREGRRWDIENLLEVFPEVLEVINKELAEDWYLKASNYRFLGFPVNEIFATPEKLPALENRIRDRLGAGSEGSNEKVIFHLAQGYVKSSIGYVRQLHARSARLLALKVRMKVEKIDPAAFLTTLKTSTDLNADQLASIESEFSQLKEHDEQIQQLAGSLIEMQLKTIARRIVVTEKKMSEVVELVKGRASAELVSLLDGYIALYNLDPDTFMTVLNSAIAGISSAQDPERLKSAINNLVGEASKSVNELNSMVEAIDTFQKDVEQGRTTVLDLIAQELDKPETSANPKMLEILLEVSAGVDNAIAAGSALQIALSDLMLDTYAEFQNRLSGVARLKQE